jgi:predicted acylesterase/phospholipase RssA
VSDKRNVLVFAGGLGLGAYHAGVYEAFSPQPLDWSAARPSAPSRPR